MVLLSTYSKLAHFVKDFELNSYGQLRKLYSEDCVQLEGSDLVFKLCPWVEETPLSMQWILTKVGFVLCKLIVIFKK